jgi:4-hydroxy-3-methylbut-2-enyl diphosphate reductase
LKEFRKSLDPRKKELNPSEINLGPLSFIIARHFGFCYGVENAIEISYKALEDNPDRNVYLLSQMIHNQEVNHDLEDRGIKFIMDTDGTQFIPWQDIHAEDIVIIPAFGTTLEIESLLKSKNIEIQQYNTTCPFVEKVWKRSSKLGEEGHTVIIHGKYRHEETRATFSHSTKNAPSVVIRDMDEAKILGKVIKGEIDKSEFYRIFQDKYSEGFDPERDFERVGVVNQTTMLATETQAIADYFKQVMIDLYGDDYKEHFADTRDTLCYATNDNQDATYALLESDADLAIVVGGYNSSNTSHIAELCQRKFPTYFINSADEILSREQIQHFNYKKKEKHITPQWLPEKDSIRIILTSGASCPDTILDSVINRIRSFFPSASDPKDVVESMTGGAEASI